MLSLLKDSHLISPNSSFQLAALFPIAEASGGVTQLGTDMFPLSPFHKLSLSGYETKEDFFMALLEFEFQPLLSTGFLRLRYRAKSLVVRTPLTVMTPVLSVPLFDKLSYFL